MTEKTVVAQLEELTELRAKLDVLKLRHKDELALLIPDEIQAAIKALEHQHAQEMATAQEAIDDMEISIKMAVFGEVEPVEGLNKTTVWYEKIT